MIHIAYAISDRDGTYSKFAGASMCSVLENTKENVTFHLLHDGSVLEEIRLRFTELVRRYGAEVHFYDVPGRVALTLQRGREILPEGMDSARYTGANMYRLLLPEVLPPELTKVIFLDADTIVNLDIGKMWQIQLGEAPLGAVSDFDVLEHFGQSHKIHPNGSFLYEENYTDVHGIFNAGVLMLNLKVLRHGENLLLAGLKFLRDHGGKWDFFDNDILIGFFARKYMHLPWHFHIRLGWALAYGGNEAETGIYHYVDRNYSLNPKTALHALFLQYLSESPWGGAGALCSVYQATKAQSLLLMQARLAKIRLIDNAARGKKRVFQGLKADESRLRADFQLGEEEVFVHLVPGGEFHLTWSTETHFYLVFWSNYSEVKTILEKGGLKEYVHFADGTLMMPERTNDIFPDERSIIWKI